MAKKRTDKSFPTLTLDEVRSDYMTHKGKELLLSPYMFGLALESQFDSTKKANLAVAYKYVFAHAFKMTRKDQYEKAMKKVNKLCEWYDKKVNHVLFPEKQGHQKRGIIYFSYPSIDAHNAQVLYSLRHEKDTKAINGAYPENCDLLPNSPDLLNAGNVIPFTQDFGLTHELQYKGRPFL